MPIKVTINSSEPSVANKVIQVTIKGPIKIDYNFDIHVREALNGDFMIFDHHDIDVVILKEQKKIVAFAKDLMTEEVYGAEARLFDFLRKKGIVQYDSIQGGNIYGSLEGAIVGSKEHDIFEASAIMIAEWMVSEKPMMDDARDYDETLEDYYVNPDDAETTELGEVPHEQEKGSMAQRGMFAPYIYGRYTY